MVELRATKTLPAETKVFFLSDTHIGDGSAGDLFGRKDSYLAEALEEATTWADAIVLGGDIFARYRLRIRRQAESAPGMPDVAEAQPAAD